MSTQLKEILVALRTQINQLRADYNTALYRYRRSGRRYTPDYDQAILAQARLSYLVPLYRDLHAMAQQTASQARLSGWTSRYQQKFDALRQRIREILAYRSSADRERYFGGSMPQIAILAPDLKQPLASWEVLTLGELIELNVAQLAYERQEALRNQKASHQAKLAFLASLTEAQRTLLQQALSADAKLRGAPVLVIDSRDL